MQGARLRTEIIDEPPPACKESRIFHPLNRAADPLIFGHRRVGHSVNHAVVFDGAHLSSCLRLAVRRLRRFCAASQDNDGVGDRLERKY